MRRREFIVTLSGMAASAMTWPRAAVVPARRFPPPWSVEETDACFVGRQSRPHC